MSENEQRINQLIAYNISKLLREKNRTQLELAEYLGVTQATVSNWCTGVKMPRMDKIDAICQFFDVKRSSLMEEDDPSSSGESDQVDSLFIDDKEQHLIDVYRSLNNAGKQKLSEYADDLSDNHKYLDQVFEPSGTYGSSEDSGLLKVAEDQVEYVTKAI